MAFTATSAPIGFMPLLREGDLLFNAFVLHYRMFDGISFDETVMDVRGTHGRVLHPFGDGAELITRRVFGASTRVRDVLMRHTSLGALCRAMSPAAEAACVNSKARRRSTDVMRHLGHGQGPNNLTVAHLRFCSTCVESDLEEQGFATWRVLHQFRPIERCPMHGATLAYETEAPLCTSSACLHLPGEQPAKEVGNCLPMSEGYANYLELWRLAFAGNLPVIRPEAWFKLMRLIVGKFGGIRNVQYVLERTIERTWETGISAVGEHLALCGGDDFVAAELALASRPKDLPRRFVVYAAAKHAGIATEEHEQFALDRGQMMMSPHEQNVGPSATLYQELWDAVVPKGFPCALVDAMFENACQADAARLCGVAPLHVSSLVRSVPDTLLLKLAKHAGAVHRTSWIGRELTRRTLTASAISPPE